MHSFLFNYFYDDLYSQYEDIDISISIDENSNSRYFSITHLYDNIDKQKFNFVSPYFEIKTLINLKDSQNYVNVLASSLETLKSVSDINNINSIKANEVLITKTISQEFNINLNDEISLKIGTNDINYKVIGIVENGIMNEYTLFIDKTANINYLLKAMDPKLENLPSIFVKNLYNKIYIGLKNNQEIDTVLEDISNIPAYNNLVVEKIINIDRINEHVLRNTSILYLVFAVIIFAVLLVMNSTTSVVFEERKKSFSTVLLLGGNRRFIFILFICEVFILILTSSISSIFITNLIYKTGLLYIDSNLKFSLSNKDIIIGLSTVSITLFIITIFNFIKVSKQSSLQLGSYKISNQKRNRTIIIVGFIILITCMLIYYKFIEELISYNYSALVKLSFCIIFGYLFYQICLILLERIYKNKRTFFTLISIDTFKSNKVMHSTIHVLLISFAIIILLISSNSFVKDKLNENVNSVKADFAMTNISSNYDYTYENLVNNEKVKNVDKAYFYSNTKLKETNSIFLYHVSLDPDSIDDYFDFMIDEKTLMKLNDTNTGYVILPNKFYYANGYRVNDKITLELNKEYNNEEFIIAGFYNFKVEDYVITNIYNYKKYQSLKPNSILLNSSIEKNQLKNFIIENYSYTHFYLMDFDEMILYYNTRIEKMVDYIVYIIFIIIVCFSMTIFNNSALLFSQMKSLYSRLSILGASKIKLVKNIILESSLMLFLVILSIILISPIFSINIKYLIIFFGSFVDINVKRIDIINGIVISSGIYLISYIYYLLKLYKLDIINVLKDT